MSLFKLQQYDPSNPSSARFESASGDAVRQSLETAINREGGQIGNSKRVVFEVKASGSRYLDVARSYFEISTTVGRRVNANGALTRMSHNEPARMAPLWPAALFESINVQFNDSNVETITDVAELAAYELRTTRSRDWMDSHVAETQWPTGDNVGVATATGLAVGGAPSVALDGAHNAGGFAEARHVIDNSSDEGRSSRTVCWRPPLQLWNISELIPAAKVRITMVLHRNALQRMFQNTGAAPLTVKTTGDNTATAPGEIFAEINDIRFVGVYLEGGDSAAAASYNGDFQIPMAHVQCLKQDFLNVNATMRWTVHPSTTQLSLAFGDKRANNGDPRCPPAYFTPGLSLAALPTPGDKITAIGLKTWQLTYAGQQFPFEPAELEYSVAGGDDLYSHYLNHVLAISGDDLPGESYDEWKRRGILLSYRIVKPQAGEFTEVSWKFKIEAPMAVTSSDGAAGAPVGAFPMLFATSQAVLVFSVQGGKVVAVRRNED